MENRIANASTGRLLSGIVSDAEDLVQQQFALFRAEIKEDVREARKAFMPVIIGGAVLFLGAIVLCFALVYILDAATPLPLWACFSIVAAFLCIGGGIAVAVGMEKLREITPVAEKTVEELKENVRWLTKPN
jgi:hypothetical protein